MSNLQVKNVEPELHDQLRRRAADEGLTISEYVLELIRRDLRRPPRRAWLERAARINATDIDTGEIISIRDQGRNR